MNLFYLYMLFFGLSTLIGVPLLSSFQITQIKGSSWGDWASSLGTSLGPAAGMFVVFSIITYVIIKPLLLTVKKAEREEISHEEKVKAVKILNKVNLVSYISLFTGYSLGNGSAIIIKTLKGKVNYNLTDLIIIMILILLFALLAVQYSVVCFNSMARKELTKLRITTTDGFKTSTFSTSLGYTVVILVSVVAWHLFCTGYSAVRHGWGIQIFLGKAVHSFIEALVITVPLLFLILSQLKIRFMLTIKQVRRLRLEGDLSSQLSIGTFDDFGLVMTEMNELISSLKTLMIKLKEENLLVDSGADELMQVTSNTSRGMEEIVTAFASMNEQNSEKDGLLNEAQQNIASLNENASKVSSFMESQALAEKENATSISAMVGNFDEISKKIEKAQSLSRELTGESDSGNEEVKETQAIIEGITEKSKQMIDVIEVIQAVASQTNLLAMNAAIEAAHAGEAGKGFSVVADEIRKLSESTQNSAKDISLLITEMAESMEGGSSNMESTSQAFSKIRQDIGEQTKVVEEISMTVERQARDASLVLEATEKAMNQLNEAASLVRNQATYTGEIKTRIDNVVSLSEKVNSSLLSSQKVINDFASSMGLVQEKAEQNKDSVISITQELNKYKIQ